MSVRTEAKPVAIQEYLNQIAVLEIKNRPVYVYKNSKVNEIVVRENWLGTFSVYIPDDDISQVKKLVVNHLKSSK